MPLDHYVTLGRSGLRVSPLCLGAMTFGEDWGWGATVKDSEAIIDRFLARGGNFIDTANGYTKGHSEKILGDHLCKDRAKRDRVVLATKFVSNMYNGDPNGGGAGRKAIVQQCEQSLRRLQTDYIDLYWMHAWDVQTPIEETMRALDDLVSAGKVRFIGFSDAPAWKCTQAQLIAQFRGWAPLIALQIEYSLLERTVEAELFPMAIELGMGVTPWSPLGGGALTGKFKRADHGKHQPNRGARVNNRLTPKAYDAIEAMEEMATELGTTVARVALAWVASKRGVSSIIIGARTMEQLDDNLSSADVVLTPAMVTRLDTLTAPALPFPMNMINIAPSFINGGTHVNGVQIPAWPASPQTDKERW
ncbi:MAG TPA: aldo/keto reductase [Kofleriaceae bacterium]|jgi:aryl-alcohol dehydrogenase-like predicted oxidoreductase